MPFRSCGAASGRRLTAPDRILRGGSAGRNETKTEWHTDECGCAEDHGPKEFEMSHVWLLHTWRMQTGLTSTIVSSAARSGVSEATCGTLSDHYGRNSRVILMTKARVDSSDQRSPSAPVFRSSVYTTNSSLPGAHSHRNRKFPLTA